MEEALAFGLLGRLSDLGLSLLLLEELTGVVLHLTAAGARSVGESCRRET